MLLDGELVFFDHEGKSHKELDSRYVKGISFMAFDILFGPENIDINSKITLTYKKGENYCTYKGKDSNNTKSYNINISTPPVKGIDKYTALIHELGHVMYQSPFTPMKNMLKNSEHHLLYYVYNII